MTESRKSNFLPHVSLSSISPEPEVQPWELGEATTEEFVYWTPFCSFTRISSTCFFSTLNCFNGATEDSLCSGRTWIFIFAPWRSRGPKDVEQVRCVPLALTMMMLMVMLLLLRRMMMMMMMMMMIGNATAVVLPLR